MYCSFFVSLLCFFTGLISIVNVANLRAKSYETHIVTRNTYGVSHILTKAAFFINPLSYAVKKHSSILCKTAQDSKTPCYHLDPFDPLPDFVSEAAKNGVQTVCIEGGDGTMHGVLSEFINQSTKFKNFPRFILLPGGNTNLAAKHVGVKKPNPHKINAILDNPQASTESMLPLLKIKTEHGTHNGFFFSTGALPKGTDYCFDKIYTEGIKGAAAVRTTLLRVLFGEGGEREIILKPTPYHLQFDEQEITGEHIVSIATTLPGLMIGLNPFWGTGNGPLRLTYVGADAKRLIPNMARMLKPKQSEKSSEKLAKNGFKSWSIGTAILNYHGPMVLDGEFLPETNKPISLSVSPNISFLK